MFKKSIESRFPLARIAFCGIAKTWKEIFLFTRKFGIHPKGVQIISGEPHNGHSLRSSGCYNSISTDRTLEFRSKRKDNENAGVSSHLIHFPF